ncbi:MAG: hypothetical protein ACRDNK_04915 [Solirubrobacteraceae bacterium]
MSRPVRLLTVTGVLAAVAVAATAASAATGPYVALGDSYTAAPLVPNPTGNPTLCGRSTNNYPSDVNRAIHPFRFTDASCSSATTADVTHSQSLQGGRIIPTSPAYPLHPNQAGETNMATQVLAAH